jgi:group I intron endonuclease
MKRSGIYGILNTVNGKWYIGQSANLEARQRHHLSRLGNGEHWNAHLQDAVNRYGIGCFYFCVLEECGWDVVDERERYWIAEYQSNDRALGYNKDAGGKLHKTVSAETRLKLSLAHKGRPLSERQLANVARLKVINIGRISPMRGQKMSEEARRKMSIAKLGKPNGRLGTKASESARLNMSLSHMEKTHSEAQRAKMSAIMKNRYFSPEHRRKISEALRGRPPTPAQRENLNRMHAMLRGKKIVGVQLENIRRAADAKRGVPRSEEFRKKIKASWVIRKMKTQLAEAA